MSEEITTVTAQQELDGWPAVNAAPVPETGLPADLEDRQSVEPVPAGGESRQEEAVLIGSLLLGQDDSQEVPARRRLELLYAPVATGPRGTEADLTDDEFAHLLGVKDKFTTVEEAAVRPDTARAVTEESLQQAALILAEAQIADPDLAQLIDDYQVSEGSRLSMSQKLDAIRRSSDLRVQLGEYLTTKMNRPEVLRLMPDRVARDTRKSPSTKGYEHIPGLTSREYAVLLALSMLDGSFNWQNDQSDPITYDPSKGDGVGQHRYAARMLLVDRL